MTSSNYLPPFTSEERAAFARGRRHAVHAAAPVENDLEATYADFLGDEVDD